jgi:hypothetical protein
MLPIVLICSFTRNNLFINIAELEDIKRGRYSPEYHVSIFDEIEQKTFCIDKKTQSPVIFSPKTKFKVSLGRTPIDIAKSSKITKKKDASEKSRFVA